MARLENCANSVERRCANIPKHHAWRGGRRERVCIASASGTMPHERNKNLITDGCKRQCPEISIVPLEAPKAWPCATRGASAFAAGPRKARVAKARRAPPKALDPCRSKNDISAAPQRRERSRSRGGQGMSYRVFGATEPRFLNQRSTGKWDNAVPRIVADPRLAIGKAAFGPSPRRQFA